MLNLSASQIKLYRECRYQYYDRYILKLPRSQDTSGLLGTAIHKAIEKHYETGANVYNTFQTRVSETLTHWQDTGVNVTYTYSYASILQQGREILDGLDLTQFQPATHNDSLMLELPFELDYYGLCNMRGYIDMITTDNVIVDWKTAKRKPKNLDDDPQFLLYAWAFFQEYGDLPKRVTWYHLRTHHQIDLNFGTDYWKRLDKVTETVQEMINDTFEDIQPMMKCSHCTAPWCARKIL